MITMRDIAAIRSVAEYHVLSRVQLQKLCYPTDRTGRATRKRLDMLVAMRLLRRTPTPIFNRRGGSPWPAYVSSKQGCDFLAGYFKDDAYLLTPKSPPPAQNLLHSLEVSETHLIFEEALRDQFIVTIPRWIGEYDIVNPDITRAEQRFQLFTLLWEYPPPRLVCAPDAAFLLSLNNEFRKIQYVEVDRETSGIRQVTSKALGYSELFKRRLHLRHFPDATDDRFNVLLVTLSARRRDKLKRAFREKPHAELWRFVAKEDLTPETCLFGAIYHRCHKEPRGLISPEHKAEYDAARAAEGEQRTIISR